MRGLSLAGLWLSSTGACCKRDLLPKAAQNTAYAARMAGIAPDEIEQVWAEVLAALSDDELDEAYTATLVGRATEAPARRTFEALALYVHGRIRTW